MRIKLLTILSVALLFTACKKEDGKAHIIVNVKSGSAPIPNVYVSLLTDEHRIYWSADSVSAKADNNGRLQFDVVPGKTYYLSHQSYKWTLDPANGSYMLIGKFDSQHDIDYSPAQTPPGTVGGNKYQDINVDGAVNPWDLVLKISAPAAGKTLNVDFPMVVKHP
ncbi:hypothetical protein [Mucilaginibacter celer]|nr:hypothetical protein [Mucilaginibacter celer]